MDRVPKVRPRPGPAVLPSEDIVLRDRAAALFSAKELAEFVYPGTNSRAHDHNKWLPVLWREDGSTLMWASLGRTEEHGPVLYMERPHNPHQVPRSVALAFLENSWESYTHLGLVPQAPERRGCRGQENNEAVERLRKAIFPPADIRPASPSLVRPETCSNESPIRSWLFDSGCGSDLISEQEVLHLRDKWTDASTPRYLSTAGGLTKSDYEVPLHIASLGEDIAPWILPSTPAVLSMGRRCVLDGFDFWWPPYSQSPRLSTPSGKVIYLTVRGDIPFLEDGLVAAPATIGPSLPFTPEEGNIMRAREGGQALGLASYTFQERSSDGPAPGRTVSGHLGPASGRTEVVPPYAAASVAPARKPLSDRHCVELAGLLCGLPWPSLASSGWSAFTGGVDGLSRKRSVTCPPRRSRQVLRVINSMILSAFPGTFHWNSVVCGCNLVRLPPAEARYGPVLVLVLAVDLDTCSVIQGDSAEHPVRNSFELLPHDTAVNFTPGSVKEFVVIAFASSRRVPLETSSALFDLGFAAPPLAAPVVGDDGKQESAGIEADIEEEAPAPPSAARLTLQEQAVSLEHLLTHEPKNDHCQACRRAKARHRPHRRKHLISERATRFGELVTADHVYAHSEALEGCDGARDMLVVFDVGTGLLGAYPAASKGARETMESLVHFAGNRRYRRIYTDAAPELIAAVRQIGVRPIIHDTATPGMPQTNGIAEGQVRRVVHGTRAALAQAGLPHPYWSLAARCFVFLRNTALVEGDSAWNRVHKTGHFHGLRIPFGAAVNFIPSPTAARFVPSKYDATSVPGVFLGYSVRGGYDWDNQYLVAMLEEFVGLNFHRSCSSKDHRIYIQTVGEVVFNPNEIRFPLRELWDRDNLSPVGVLARIAPDHRFPERAQDPRDHEGLDPPTPVAEGDDDEGAPDIQDPGHEPFPGGQDEWIETTTSWIRRHRVPRALPFRPDDVADGPRSDELAKHRTTHAILDSGLPLQVHHDDYMAEIAGRPLDRTRLWIGESVFSKKERRDIHGHRLDPMGQRIRRTRRPYHIPVEAWAKMSAKMKKELELPEDQREARGADDSEPRPGTSELSRLEFPRPPGPGAGGASSSRDGLPAAPAMSSSGPDRPRFCEDHPTRGETGSLGDGNPNPHSEPPLTLSDLPELSHKIRSRLRQNRSRRQSSRAVGETSSGGGPALERASSGHITSGSSGSSRRIPRASQSSLDTVYDHDSDDDAHRRIRGPAFGRADVSDPIRSNSEPDGPALERTGVSDSPGSSSDVGPALGRADGTDSEFPWPSPWAGGRNTPVRSESHGLSLRQAEDFSGPAGRQRDRPIVYSSEVSVAQNDSALLHCVAHCPSWYPLHQWDRLSSRSRVDVALGSLISDADGPSLGRAEHEAHYGPRGENDEIPAMPVVKISDQTTETECQVWNSYAAVARSVDRKEMVHNKKAQQAVQEEWDRLRSVGPLGCWDESRVRPKHDVMSEARREKRRAHFGQLMEICVEKNYDIPGKSKYKGRVVYRGDDVKDEFGSKVTVWQDLASCPATLEAAKVADMLSCTPGCSGQQADATQAYTQADFSGIESWVEIPKSQWPQSWWNKGPDWRPCCPLLRALYGHPEAGAYWEQHCERHLISLGFQSFENWPSTYWHPGWKLFLIVYVDDFKLAGKTESLPKAWAAIRKGLKMDDPTPMELFLGAKHHIFRVPRSPGTGGRSSASSMMSRTSSGLRANATYSWPNSKDPSNRLTLRFLRTRMPASVALLTRVRG